jgi:hypothetical protein
MQTTSISPVTCYRMLDAVSDLWEEDLALIHNGEFTLHRVLISTDR